MAPVDKNIRKSFTIDSSFYTSPEIYHQVIEKVFVPSYQFIGATDLVKVPGFIYPFTLLEGCLEEPLVLTRDGQDTIHCLSNVCTHRGSLVCENPGSERALRCRYHGRKFDLKGNFEYMPEMEGVEGFPSDQDNLPKVPFHIWGKWIFASLSPNYTFNELIQPLEDRVGFLPFNEFSFDPARSRDYLVNANWALYCDNYLEGFHIPYVHPSLNEVLDYGNYTTEIFDYANLQVGIAEGGEEIFNLPPDHPDFGKEVAAYYFWLFPNTMLNFYPWGLSVNIVKPLSHKQCKVSFLSYVWREDKISQGAGAGLDRVEREDEIVVENVFKGVSSRFYSRGRFSPDREQGVHHFHRLLNKILQLDR